MRYGHSPLANAVTASTANLVPFTPDRSSFPRNLNTPASSKHCLFADSELLTRPVVHEHHTIAATVHSALRIAPNVIRLTLFSPALQNYTLSGPDEFFGLIMPPAGQTFTPPPSCENSNIRAAIATMPKDDRPELRWYTIRSLNSTSGLLSFDVATHGVTDPNSPKIGPGLQWCLSAQRGDEVGLWTAQGLWHRKHQRQLLVADPSALPSVLAILDFLTQFHPEQLGRIYLIVAAESVADLELSALGRYSPHLGSVRAVFSSPDYYSQAVSQCLDELYAYQLTCGTDYVWVAGEGDLCKIVRRHAIRTLGLPASNVQWCPYWFLGKARP